MHLKSIKEILTHNHDAILCDPDNFQEWIRAIERLNNSSLDELVVTNSIPLN